MELVLTGRIIKADEAERWGLVSRVVPEDIGVVNAAVQMAATIADKGRVAVAAGKEAVNAAFEMSLAEGLRFERRLFHSLFATKDQKEGGCSGDDFVFVNGSLIVSRYGCIRRKTQTRVVTFMKRVEVDTVLAENIFCLLVRSGYYDLF